MTMNNNGDGIVFSSLKSLLALHAKARIIALGKGRIRAKNIGQHLSVFKGRGMDFAESRPYEPGDDVRTLDWRVTARTGKPHTKVFQEERERPVLIWVDMRKAMFFGTQGSFKSVVAAELAALLVWKSKDDGDRVGGMIVSSDKHIEAKPARTKAGIVQFLKQIAEFSQQQTNMQAPQQSLADDWRRLRRVVSTGSRVFILSDFRGVDKAALRQLIAIQQHAEITLIPITDPMENQLPDVEELRVTAGKRFFSINLKNRNWVKRYEQKTQNRLQNLKIFARKYRLGWVSISTTDACNERLRKLIGALR